MSSIEQNQAGVWMAHTGLLKLTASQNLLRTLKMSSDMLYDLSFEGSFLGVERPLEKPPQPHKSDI